MKKKMAVLLTGMILMTQPICGAVYGAERIEKEPVKVTGDSVHAPEVETKKEKEPIGIARGEETKEAVQETAETENAELVPELEGKNIEMAMELLEEEGLKASVWFEENEESEETAKRKEAVRNAAKDVEHMPESLEIDGKMLTAYKEAEGFGFYYDAEMYEVKQQKNDGGTFFVAIEPKDESRNTIWIDGYRNTADTDIRIFGTQEIPAIGTGCVGAYGVPAFEARYSRGEYRETSYMISTDKGYLYIGVKAEQADRWREPKEILDTFLIDGVNWEKEDVNTVIRNSNISAVDETEIAEEYAEINTETK